MSQFFDQASLVMIPSGYKNGKVYSQKPLSTDGELTFTRASSASRIAPNGLLEKVRTNVALYSEQFDNAAWTKANATITANAVANPLNGAVTADKLVEDTANSLHRVGQGAIAVTSGVPINFSFYAKAGERTQLELQRINTSGTVFNVITNNTINLTTGVVPAIVGATNYGSVSLGSGWFRYYITLTPIASGSGGLNLGLVDGSGNVSYTGDGTSGAFVFGFQAEVGDVMTDYIPTTTAAVSVGPVSGLPRLDYSGGATCPSLLLEPQRTNLISYSESFNNGYWAGSGGVTPNTAISPDGYQNADTNASGGVYPALPWGGDTTATNTASIFAKANPSGASTLRLYFNRYGFGDAIYCDYNLTNGTASAVTLVGSAVSGTAKIENYGNGWYRCILTGVVSTSAGTLSFNPINDCYIWGAQVEAGSYPTSYIPTLSTSVTRVAESASKTGISSLIGQTEGTIFVELQTLQLNPTNVSRIILSDGTTSNYMFLGLNEAGSGNLSRLYVNNTGAGTSVSVFSSTALTVGTNKLAMAYKSGSFALYLNGNLVGSSSSAVTIPATSELVIGGQSPSVITQLETMVDKQVILFKTRLTNAQLAELTTL